MPNDGYGIQFSGTVNLRDNGIPDYVWCSTNSPSSSNRDYANVPNSQCKLPIEAGVWKYPNSDGTQYRYRHSMLNEKYPYYYITTQAAGLPNQVLWCDTQDNAEPERRHKDCRQNTVGLINAAGHSRQNRLHLTPVLHRNLISSQNFEFQLDLLQQGTLFESNRQ